MTMPASYLKKIGDRIPSPGERDAANKLRQILAAHASSNNNCLNIIDSSGDPTEVTLSPALSELLIDLLEHIGNGDAVTLLPITQTLTTQQAATILNVPQRYFADLLKQGKLEYSAGRHRRVKAEDLFEYKYARDSERAAALDELVKSDADLI